MLLVSAEGQRYHFLFYNIVVSLWQLLTLGVVGEFRRAIRKQCIRGIITKEAVCSLLCINNRICRVYTLILLQDSLECVAGTYWLDHQRSHGPLQPYMTRTFTCMNCSWTISSKILGTSSPFTYFTSGGYCSFCWFFLLFSLFRSFLNWFGDFFGDCCRSILLQSLEEIVRLRFLSGVN